MADDSPGARPAPRTSTPCSAQLADAVGRDRHPVLAVLDLAGHTDRQGHRGPFRAAAVAMGPMLPDPSVRRGRTSGRVRSAAVPAPRVAVHPDGARRGSRTPCGPAAAPSSPVDDAEALVWAHPNDPDALARTVREPRRPPLGAASLRGHRAVSGRDRRRPRVDVRQGRLRRAGRRARPHPAARRPAGRGAATRGSTAGPTSSASSLFGGRVTIVGGGGIAEALVRLLVPFRPRSRWCAAARGHGRRGEGGGAGRAHGRSPGPTLVVLALALVPDTVGVIGRTSSRRWRSTPGW